MIKNFHQVTNNLYRGAAPSVADLISLSNDYDIEKVISLDKISGEKIDPFCKKLGMEHLIIDIDPSRPESIYNLFKHKLQDLIEPNINTFVHCLRGKDRTGLLIALFRCLEQRWDCKKAIKEAKLLGFGTGLDLPVELYYTNIIKSICNQDIDINKNNDSTSSDINGYDSMYRDEQLDPYIKSFAPVTTIDYSPYPYNPRRYDTEDYELQHDDQYGVIEHMPLVGEFDQNSQMTNATGPSLLSGGFL